MKESRIEQTLEMRMKDIEDFMQRSHPIRRLTGWRRQRAMRIIWLLLLFVLLPLNTLAETSAELTQQRTDTPTGYRIDYLDAAGHVTLATDKGYASVVYEVTEGHTTKEFFYSADGEPVKVSGTYGKIYLYEEDRCVQITYLDAAHQPARNASGYAIIRRTVDDAGRIVREMYFDEKDQPLALWGGQCGMSRDAFDEKNRVIQFTYLNADGTPFINTTGYTTVKRTYDAEGRSDTELYFDQTGNAVALSLGQYGQKYIRSESGTVIGLIYLDQDGMPATNAQGYASVRYEHDELGNIVCYRYYDLDDRPAALSRGQYGQVNVYDGKVKIRSYFIDAEGKEMFLLDQYLQQNPLLNLIVALLLVLAALILPKKLRMALLVCYGFFILYMTLLVREPANQRHNFELFWSYAQFLTSDTLRIEILNNILLFIPFGALIYSFDPRPASLLAALIFSALIEGTQLIFGLGLCEFDDIVSNSLGGSIGWLMVCFGHRWRCASRKVKTEVMHKG